jgi:uncharacterized protein (UPF0335 family)
MKNKQINKIEHMTPDELGALKKEVREFLSRLDNIDSEIAGLKESRKDLIDEFQGRLDIKTLTAALRVQKIQQGVEHKDTFDVFMDVITDDETNGLID